MAQLLTLRLLTSSTVPSTPAPHTVHCSALQCRYGVCVGHKKNRETGVICIYNCLNGIEKAISFNMEFVFYH